MSDWIHERVVDEQGKTRDPKTSQCVRVRARVTPYRTAGPDLAEECYVIISHGVFLWLVQPLFVTPVELDLPSSPPPFYRSPC